MDEERVSSLVKQTRDIWNTNAEFWSDTVGNGNRFYLQLVEPTVEQLLAPKANHHYLDLACGSGLFSKRLATLGATVVACDFSTKMLERSRVNCGDLADRVRLHLADATSRSEMTELAKLGPFDGIVCNMALMDMPTLEPMAECLAQSLKKGMPFVVSTAHPCFNMQVGARLTAEEEDAGGILKVERFLKLSRYISPSTSKGVGIIGQPVPHYFFHRSLGEMLRPFFKAGWVLDAIKEPTFPPGETEGRFFSWAHFSEFPPVLAFRLRNTGEGYIRR